MSESRFKTVNGKNFCAIYPLDRWVDRCYHAKHQVHITAKRRRREEYPVGGLYRESRQLKRDRSKAGEHGLGAAGVRATKRSTGTPVTEDARVGALIRQYARACCEARWYHEIIHVLTEM